MQQLRSPMTAPMEGGEGEGEEHRKLAREDLRPTNMPVRWKTSAPSSLSRAKQFSHAFLFKMFLLLSLLVFSRWMLPAICQKSNSSQGTTAPTPYRLLPALLDTPWTDQVGTNPWPQHPRPLMYRDSWQTLNGIWTFEPASGSGDLANPPSLPLSREVLIPSCIESALSGIMVSNLMYMWFATSFTVPSGSAGGHGGRTLLHFDAVDYEATVFLNGKQVGFNRGGYYRFSIDITDILKKDGPNEL